MIPVGTGWHIDPWRRTPLLAEWLRTLVVHPSAQIIADNILWDGLSHHFEPIVTIPDYPGHLKAVDKLLAVIAQPSYLRDEPHLIKGLKDLIADLPFSRGIGVEVGSYIGESTLLFANSGKFERLICVDIWQDWAEPSELLFDQRTYNHPVINKLKMPSTQAAELFEPQSLDFVYIDADHTYEGVRADILAWQPKIKPGGVLAGHDYNSHHHGLKRAVNQLLGRPKYLYDDQSWLKFL